MAILIWGFIFSYNANAQIHLGIGVVDISDRMDGNTLTWNIGYRQPIGKFGVGFNYRYTGVLGENFRSWEFRLPYRVFDGKYRLEAVPGWAFNQKDKDSYPVLHVRNAFKIAHGTYAAIDFDNSFRQGYRRRTETYLSVAIVLDYDFIKDVFGGRPRQQRRFF
ncbi:MAG: hypothetical protein AAF600_13145 [Bacteroidota bacterium]